MTEYGDEEMPQIPCPLYEAIKGREKEIPTCNNCNNGTFGNAPENC